MLGRAARKVIHVLYFVVNEQVPSSRVNRRQVPYLRISWVFVNLDNCKEQLTMSRSLTATRTAILLLRLFEEDARGS